MKRKVDNDIDKTDANSSLVTDSQGIASGTSNNDNQSNKKDPDIILVSGKFYQFGLYSGGWNTLSNSPHGEGRYSRGGILLYDGNWKHGAWSGFGTVYDETGKVCSGSYLNGKLHGFATLYKEDETIDCQSYHVYGVEMPDIQSDEEFQQQVAEADLEKKKQAEEEASRKQQQVQQLSHQSTIKSFSMTLDSSNPIMSAPIEGLFPRYAEIPIKMLEGCGFPDLQDEEIPTPTNLESGKTREDWIIWVRKYYPKK